MKLTRCFGRMIDGERVTEKVGHTPYLAQVGPVTKMEFTDTSWMTPMNGKI